MYIPEIPFSCFKSTTIRTFLLELDNKFFELEQLANKQKDYEDLLRKVNASFAPIFVTERSEGRPSMWDEI